MKVLIIDYPWKKTWLSLYAEAFTKLGHEVAVWDGKSNARIQKPDIVLCTWADRDFTELFPEAKHTLMMRRFEFFHAAWLSFKWDKINALICCNPWIASQVRSSLNGSEHHCGPFFNNVKVHYINNPVDTSKWTFKDRTHGKNIGMVCRIHSVKNLPLAAQIVMGLPGYQLHIAGESNDTWIEAYIHNLDVREQIVFHGRVPNEKLDSWWEGMDYCLSTSISEGDPMNVLEACAKGIKPVIHNWPGAEQMYPPGWVFDSIGMARQMIDMGHYMSKEFRAYVTQTRPVELADKVAGVAIG